MITVTGQTFLPVDRATDGTTKYQDGCIGGRYKTVLSFYWQKGTLIASGQGITTSLSINGNTITDVTNYTTGQQSENFVNEFSVGESIKLPGSALNVGTYVITALTTSTITVGTALTAELPNSQIWVTNLITGLDYFYNLLKNGTQTPSFYSLTDPSVQQKYVITGLNAAVTAPVYFTIGTSNMAWVNDTLAGKNSQAFVNGVSITADYKQQFTLTHDYFITPLAILSQKAAFANALISPINPTAPSYYPLAYYYQFNTYYDSGPVIVDSYNGNSLGVASWVDTNNSGTAPEFTSKITSYIDSASGVPLTSLDFGKTNIVSLTVKSATGQFINPEDGDGNTFILSHIFLSGNSSTYTKTATTLRQNFLHDRAIQVAGAAAVNEEFYGTPFAVISEVEITYVSAYECTVLFTVNYSAQVQSILAGLSNNNYALLCEVE